MLKDRYGDLAVSLKDHVALAVIERPPHNFFDRQLIADMADAFEELDRTPQCRAIVLASQGKAFCAGANFTGGASVLEASQPRNANPLYDAGLRLFACTKPVVAAVQGAAVGGGLGVALFPDFRVASPEARFAANFVKVGMHPGFGLTVTLPRVIGEQKALLMFMTGRRIDGETAYAWGLADMLVPAEKLRDTALQFAAEIAENAPLAVQSTRTTLRRSLAAAVRERIDREHAEQIWLARTEDHKEGIKAVAERRPGKFAAR